MAGSEGKIRKTRRVGVRKVRAKAARWRKRARQRLSGHDREARRLRWLPLVAVVLGISATVALGQIAAWLTY